MGTRHIIVVGLGSIGRRHARLLLERTQLGVSACEPSADSIAANEAASTGLRIYSTFEAALDARPDAVVIATPHHLHCEQTLAALERGVAVLCEKPMAATLAEADRMALAAAAPGSPPLSFGFMLHFHPLLLRVRQLLASGELGTVVQARYLVGTLITLRNSRSRYQADLAGALLMDYAHQPDLLAWLLQAVPEGVYMAGVQGGAPELTSNPNALSLICDYRQPLLSSIDLNYLQVPQRHEAEIVADQGSVRFNLDTQELVVCRVRTEREEREQFRVERDDLYREEHTAFLAALDGAAPPSSPAAEAIGSMQVIDAAMRSWRERRRVTLNKST